MGVNGEEWGFAGIIGTARASAGRCFLLCEAHPCFAFALSAAASRPFSAPGRAGEVPHERMQGNRPRPQGDKRGVEDGREATTARRPWAGPGDGWPGKTEKPRGRHGNWWDACCHPGRCAARSDALLPRDRAPLDPASAPRDAVPRRARDDPGAHGISSARHM
jgi:hypothetical protein